jgi:hypothetical protein
VSDYAELSTETVVHKVYKTDDDGDTITEVTQPGSGVQQIASVFSYPMNPNFWIGSAQDRLWYTRNFWATKSAICTNLFAHTNNPGNLLSNHAVMFTRFL